MENPDLSRESTPKEIIERLYSLQWCRENLVVPLGFDTSRFTGNEVLTIAIGNFSYLATIGDFIKYRAEQAQIEVQFIEKSPIEIQSLLDHAAGEN